MTMHYYQTGGHRRPQASGTSAGGNTLSHRPGAVPGYSGFTPASMCIQPAVHTRLTERDPTAPPFSAAERKAAANEAAAAAAGGTT